MNKFEYLEDGIYRLCIQFDNIYTSIFLLNTDSGTILLDSATSDKDVKNYIMPALNLMNVTPDMIIISHFHNDHCGGIEALLKAFPKCKAGFIDKNKVYSSMTIHLEQGDVLFDRFKVLNLKGHTEDCLGIFDLKTKTLFSCDALQQKGIGKYKTYLENKNSYLSTINYLQTMDIKKIISSHDYDPYGCIVEGTENISLLYSLCEQV